jgi:hypothetical protein
VPGLLALRFISPVLVLTNMSPAGEALKIPALEPLPNKGSGFELFSQKGVAKENAASGALVMVSEFVSESGQLPLVVYVMEYVPGVVAPRLTTPVEELTNSRPEGSDLNVPPGRPVISGTGFKPDAQNVPLE